MRYTDLSEDLHKIEVPLMGIYGKKDVIVNPNQHELVQKYAKQPHVVYLDDAGHFPMLDDPDNFVNVIRDFLAE